MRFLFVPKILLIYKISTCCNFCISDFLFFFNIYSMRSLMNSCFFFSSSGSLGTA
jgi:hypothetical protein